MAAKKESNYTVSAELDELSCELMGQALDLLAEGEDVNVLLAVADAAGNVASFEFADDGEEACLAGARNKVRSLVRSKGVLFVVKGEAKVGDEVCTSGEFMFMIGK